MTKLAIPCIQETHEPETSSLIRVLYKTQPHAATNTSAGLVAATLPGFSWPVPTLCACFSADSHANIQKLSKAAFTLCPGESITLRCARSCCSHTSAEHQQHLSPRRWCFVAVSATFTSELLCTASANLSSLSNLIYKHNSTITGPIPNHSIIQYKADDSPPMSSHTDQLSVYNSAAVAGCDAHNSTYSHNGQNPTYLQVTCACLCTTQNTLPAVQVYSTVRSQLKKGIRTMTVLLSATTPRNHQVKDHRKQHCTWYATHSVGWTWPKSCQLSTWHVYETATYSNHS